MDWMISLRKHIDGAGPLPPVTLPPIPAQEPAPALVNQEAWCELLAVVSDATNKAVPGVGIDLARGLKEIREKVMAEAGSDISPATRDRVRTDLDVWASKALQFHADNEREIKEIMNGVARAAESIGKRDQKYGRQVGDLTSRLRSIADMKDLAPIRRSILDTTAALKACMDKLAEENKSAVTELSAQVEHFRAKLAEAEEAAAQDSLTRLANRGAFERHLEERIRFGSVFSLIMIDLNGFKLVNDSWGHVAGDSLLTQFSAELRNQFRATDLVGRWGGDEFVVIVDGGIVEAESRASRVRQWAFGEYVLDAGTRQVKVTVAAGMGVVEWDGRETGTELLDRADQKLYSSKAHRPPGRHQTGEEHLPKRRPGVPL